MENLPQKILLFSLYGFIGLMIVFSFLSLKNIGQDGYDQCIQKKCDERGETFCSKQRELSNCCQGAGGELGIIDNKLGCVFN